MKRNKNNKQKSKGLGDTIEKITEATGIKTAVEKVFGKSCGCDKRKETLNKIFPYSKPNCLTEPEYTILKDFFKTGREIITSDDQKILIPIYNRILNKKQEISNCPSCVRNMVRDLEKIYVEYDKE